MDPSFCNGDEEACPYYRPRSNSCLWVLCNHYKEKVMSNEFHFIAVAGNQNTSGQCHTLEDAQKWAEAQMATKTTLTKVYIYAVQAVVERESPPVRLRRIPLSPEALAHGERPIISRMDRTDDNF